MTTSHLPVLLGTAAAFGPGRELTVVTVETAPLGRIVWVRIESDYCVGSPSVYDCRGNTYTLYESRADESRSRRQAICYAHVMSAVDLGDAVTTRWPAEVDNRSVEVYATSPVLAEMATDLSAVLAEFRVADPSGHYTL